MADMTPLHLAVELEDLPRLRDLLDAGGDIHDEDDYGFTLLHHAIDVEIDGHTQTGEPLEVSTTAYLLARGADPLRRPEGGRGVTAEHMAFVCGHWLATALFEVWRETHPDRT
ncbi:ankyrin repeat domain-containing protein [Frankia sp. CNm7]|uniref:Ankyrin repeat domain-containing protein n=1 Tax=Frankia nepalensis TaxID=1836974 RepID=A0A937R9I2_9ACTN|nr:ankyrin repeat domain-containing protein [Frankia nepalensis]MBL7498753.1 ankyrin repeat domain-containing protein [Frankia nepalensis]MBL7508383.1 ankyrin repeat domain-containing protein [Frankia nepalensis]MBL7517383.1 ankyrin repeat domain-containing protein [Frankia nepalensis]MBL7626212.1 ankyrin repeat domain-containing protein [Frankia nepalensis]